MTTAETQARRAILLSLETIFRDELSDVSKAVMASTFAGIMELVKRGEFSAAKILVSGISTPPPGITVERMEEVKTLILSKIP
tara:strand:- start:1693 stop:1941 length:249 start_codon:yes stop_codon:yes gene_type:complete